MVIKSEQDNIVNCCAFIMLCMWFLIPKLQIVTGKFFLFVLLISWILSSNFKYILQSIIHNIWFFVWYSYMLLLLIFGLWEYGFVEPISFFIDVPLFFLASIIFSYYYSKKNFLILAKGCIVSLLSIFIGSINSLIKLFQYPMASRILATGQIESKKYAYMGIGGYSYVYASVMIMVLVIYLLKTENLHNAKIKIALLILYIVNFMFVIKASYTIAILFAIFLSVVSLVKIRNLNWLMFIGMLCGGFLIMLKKQIGYILVFLAESLPNGQVSYGKILDFAQGLISNKFGVESLNRFKLYLKSVSCFLNNPMYGRIWSTNANYSIGNHSAWLDLLGAFGLIGSLPIFILLFLKFRRMIKLWKYNDYANYVAIVQLYVFIFGFINPIINVYEFGFVLFLITPSLPYIFLILNKNNSNEIIHDL